MNSDDEAYVNLNARARARQYLDPARTFGGHLRGATRPSISRLEAMHARGVARGQIGEEEELLEPEKPEEWEEPPRRPATERMRAGFRAWVARRRAKREARKERAREAIVEPTIIVEGILTVGYDDFDGSQEIDLPFSFEVDVAEHSDAQMRALAAVAAMDALEEWLDPRGPEPAPAVRYVISANWRARTEHYVEPAAVERSARMTPIQETDSDFWAGDGTLEQGSDGYIAHPPGDRFGPRGAGAAIFPPPARSPYRGRGTWPVTRRSTQQRRKVRRRDSSRRDVADFM